MTRRRRINLLWAMMSFVLFTSCVQDEIPVDPRLPGEIKLGEANMSADYRYQVYYDLGTNQVVRQNLKTEWDLGFEGSSDGWHIILNNAKAMGVHKTEINSIEIPMEEESWEWSWDAETGSLDSTAIGEWREHNQVYIVDRGYDYEGQLIGLKKIQFNSVDANSYSFKFSNLDGSEMYDFVVPKNDNVNFVCFSFDGGGTVADIEPPKEDWDLVFTQYLKFYDGEDLPDTYLVTGTLINRYQTLGYDEFELDFEELKFTDVDPSRYIDEINVIGHDWKFFDFDTGFFVMNDHQNYLIQDSENRTYKLHFIDFYDNLGEKGHPVFELQEF